MICLLWWIWCFYRIINVFKFKSIKCCRWNYCCHKVSFESTAQNCWWSAETNIKHIKNRENLTSGTPVYPSYWTCVSLILKGDACMLVYHLMYILSVNTQQVFLWTTWTPKLLYKANHKSQHFGSQIGTKPQIEASHKSCHHICSSIVLINAWHLFRRFSFKKTPLHEFKFSTKQFKIRLCVWDRYACTY